MYCHSYNILLLITQLEYAGAQKALFTLGRGLKNMGYRVHVAIMYDKTGSMQAFSDQYNLSITNLKMKKGGNRHVFLQLIDFAHGLIKLFRLLKEGSYDILQTFSHYSNILGPIVAWLAGIDKRVSSQRMTLRKAPKWLLIVDRLVANSFLVNKMVAVSNGTLEFCVKNGIKRSKLETIYNGIDTETFKPDTLADEVLRVKRIELGLEETDLVISTIARLHPQKGHKYLLLAIPKIVDKYPKVKFLFVGDGDELDNLEQAASSLGIKHSIQFLGVRTDIPEFLAISSLLVLPSLWEGLPNIILEAMSMEIPVIASNVDGCPEIIIHNKNGLLVTPADPKALESAIVQLLKDRDGCVQMGKEGRRHVIDHFSISTYIQAFHDLYCRI